MNILKLLMFSIKPDYFHQNARAFTCQSYYSPRSLLSGGKYGLGCGAGAKHALLA